MENYEDAKPDLSSEDAAILIKKLYGLEVEKPPKELNSYDDRNYHVHAKTGHKLGYILKVVNSLDSKNVALFEAQSELLIFLHKEGISTPLVIPNKEGKTLSIELLGKKKKAHIVRLLQFLPGEILKSVPASTDLYFQVGVSAAELDNALQKFQHPGLVNHKSLWHLKSLPEVKNYIKYVPEPDKQTLVASVIDAFITLVQPETINLPSGIIHGDLNEQNILVTQNEIGWKVTSILDFGDINIGCYVFEIATAIAYMMMDCVRSGLEPFECGKATLQGYRTIWPLTATELRLLKICICGRITQSLVLGLYTRSLQPDNEYIADTQVSGWQILDNLWNKPDDEIRSFWELGE